LQGYANPQQYAAGIHTRLYARAFVVADAADPSARIAFVNMDAGMASQAVTFTVVAKLKELYGELYSEQNVALSGTHTHAGPAGVFPASGRGSFTSGLQMPLAVALAGKASHADLPVLCCPVVPQGTCSTSCTASPPSASTARPLTRWWRASCLGGQRRISPSGEMHKSQ
jgi:hypothetical protein